MASYEQILRLLRYRNWHTRALLDRKFKLVCSELNGRYVSNEFQVEVSVVGPGSSVWLQARESPPPTQPSHLPAPGRDMGALTIGWPGRWYLGQAHSCP